MMKRIILLTAFILSFSLLGMSQSSGTYTAKKVNTKTVKVKATPQFEKGWYLRPEVGVSIGHSLNLDVLFNTGYQINPYFFIGMGTGVYSVSDEDYYWWSSSFPLFATCSFPLFATCRVDFLTTKYGFTPFFEIKMGYSFGLWGDNYASSYHNTKQKKSQGLYGYSGVGLDWHNFNLLFSWHFVNIRNRGIVSNYDCLRSLLSLSLAYNIPLNKKSQSPRQP